MTEEFLDINLQHAAVLAAHHVEVTPGSAWSDASYRDLLALPSTFGWLICDDQQPKGFILCQAAVDQVEVLMLAVCPNSQRQGFGGSLLEHTIEYCANQGVACLHLEVAEDNQPAKALYFKFGFEENGSRPGYYKRSDHNSIDALCMRCQI